MSWASKRCKPQPRYPSLSIALLCPALRRSAALSKSLWRLTEQHPALLRHRLPVTIKPAPQLLPQSSASHRSASLCFALQHVTDQCSVQPRPVSLHHRSKFTIKTWPQLLLQVHEPGRGYPRALLRKLLLSELSRHLLLRGAAMPGFARRYGVLQVASSLHHRSRFTIKTWPHVC